MSHDRTDSASTSASSSASASSSTSLHLPSIDSQDSATHAHDGLYRAHRANNLTVSHAARLNALDARTRASPVKLRFVRSPTSGTISSTGSSAAPAASRIPLPRSVSAPEKLKESSNNTDAVQMASHPTPALSSSALYTNPDHPPRKEQALLQGHARPSLVTNTRTSTNAPPSSTSSQDNSARPNPTPQRSPTLLAHAHTGPQGQSPTPPKRHPLRPVLQSPRLLGTAPTAKPHPQLSRLSASPQSSTSSIHEEPSFSSAPNTSDRIHQTVLVPAPSSDSLLLTPASTEDGSSTPNSAAYISAFSSPLDSASVPRSFLQQQQQQASSNLRSISEDIVVPADEDHSDVARRSKRDAKNLELKYSHSDASEQSIRSAKTRERDHSTEEEILASAASSTFDGPLTSTELGIVSPGLLSGQTFSQTSPGAGTTFFGTDTRLHRSHSLSSSISSMSSSLTGSESLSSHDRTAQPFNPRQRRTEYVNERIQGAVHVEQNEGFLNFIDVMATPKQVRRVASSSETHSLPPHITSNTPRTTASHQETTTSVSKASAALVDVADITRKTTSSPQTPNLSLSSQRKRDGTFGTTGTRDLNTGQKAESPSSINDKQTTPPLRPQRAESDQSFSIGHGHLPRSGTVGDLSFSGSPSLSNIVNEASPKGVTNRSLASTKSNNIVEVQQSPSGNVASLAQSNTPSGSTSASASGGSAAQYQTANLLPHSDKMRDGLSKSRSHRPAVMHKSSSSTSAQGLSSREIKMPIVPGMEDETARGTVNGTTEGKKSWKKAGQEYLKWDISQPLWYKAPQWGRLPQKGMRAHSATLVPNVSPFASHGTRTSSTRPTETDLFAMDPTSGSVGSSLYVFGGCDSKHCFKDLYKIDLQSFQWSKPRTLGNQFSPPALRAHSVTHIPPFQSLYSSVYDNLEIKDRFPDDPDVINVRMKSREGHLLFFGGGDGPNYFNDIYLLNLTTMTWSKPLPAPVATPHEGQNLEDFANEAHTDIAGSSNTQHIYGTLPSPRRAHTTVWYDKRKELIIFGGGNGTKALNEVWVLECKDWKRLTWKKINTLGKKPRVRGYRE